MSSGRTYMVGEQGPELLRLQGGNGVVTSNARSGNEVGGGTGNTYNVYGYPDDQTMRQIERREQLVALRKRMAS